MSGASTTDTQTSFIDIGDAKLELVRGGSGRPILFLHPEIGLSPTLPVLELLARRGQLLAPMHPGFGHSSLPRHITSVDDLSYFYLDFLEHLNLRDVIVVGVSFGAWIAAELAVKTCERISHLVLADPVGIKRGRPDEAEIVDLFAITREDFLQRAFADPNAGKRDDTSLSDEQALLVARQRETVALMSWTPYMHNPKLKSRLHRISAPTLVLWGEQDRITARDYARGFADLIPGAQFDTLANMGHFPHMEQPETFVHRIFQFAG